MTRNTLSAALIALTFGAAAASAQQAAAGSRPAARPAATAPATAAPATAAAPSAAMIAIVYTDNFSDPRNGIARLANAAQALDREFKPRRDELQTLQTNLEKIASDLQKVSSSGQADPTSLQRQREQAEQMQLDIQRKGQDAQRAYEKRAGEVLAPIQTAINQQLVEYARGRGFNLLLNATAMEGQLIPLSNTMDITQEFIADFNRRNPATAAAARP